MNVRASNTEPLLRLNVEGDYEGIDGAPPRRSARADSRLANVPEAPKDAVAALDALRDLLAGEALAPWPGREGDLARLAAERARLERRFMLAVAGEFSSGKSFLLNALLGKVARDDRAEARIGGLLAIDINPSTATITELEYARRRVRARALSIRPRRTHSARSLGTLRRRLARRRGRAARCDRRRRFGAVVRDRSRRLAFLGERLRRRRHAGTRFAESGAPPRHARLSPAYRCGALSDRHATAVQRRRRGLSRADRRARRDHLHRANEDRSVARARTRRRGRPGSTRASASASGRRASRRRPRSSPLSARDFAQALLDGDAALRAESGFDELLDALERSLEARAQADRVQRVTSVLGELGEKTAARLRREAALLAAEREELAADTHPRSKATCSNGNAFSRGSAMQTARAGAERAAWIEAQGRARLDDARTRCSACSSAHSTSPTSRAMRDRAKFHILADDDRCRERHALCRRGRRRTRARALDRLRTGASPACASRRRRGAAPTAESPAAARGRATSASGLASTIVLGALGRPSVSFVHEVASAFAAASAGTYMKRELIADLAETFLPNFEREFGGFDR